MKDNITYLGTNIKLLRIVNELSMQDLFDYIGVSKSFISDIEKGKNNNVGLIILLKLSRFFRVNLESLVALDLRA